MVYKVVPNVSKGSTTRSQAQLAHKPRKLADQVQVHLCVAAAAATGGGDMDQSTK